MRYFFAILLTIIFSRVGYSTNDLNKEFNEIYLRLYEKTIYLEPIDPYTVEFSPFGILYIDSEGRMQRADHIILKKNKYYAHRIGSPELYND